MKSSEPNNNSITKHCNKSSCGGAPCEGDIPVGFKPQIIWTNTVAISAIHILAVYTILFPHRYFKLPTIIYGWTLGYLSGFGVTGGAHRLWAHRAYKATWQLKVILLILFSIAGQNSMYEWVRDHRLHHRHSETDADPHNAKRGFFFAHVGWLMQRRHPEVKRLGRQVDMSDITSDPLLRFHTKYFLWIKILFCFILPTLVPIYCWGEDIWYSILAINVLRYALSLNFTWLVNSAAHIYGYKPYDKRINPSENLAVSIVAVGEGWHNYHHVFPWDYKAAELAVYPVNLTTLLLDGFAKLGWAYDLKTASPDRVRAVMLAHGDGSHHPMAEQPRPA